MGGSTIMILLLSVIPTYQKVQYGFATSAKWKGFDISVFFRGAAQELIISWEETDITRLPEV